MCRARDRARLNPPALVGRWIAGRSKPLVDKLEADFQKLDSAAGWKAFSGRIRRNLWRTMFPATGGRMPERTPLEAAMIYDLPGSGFRCQGVIFQSRPGLPVAATLYVPDAKSTPAAGKRPALIMIPAHHTSRNSRDLATLGANPRKLDPFLNIGSTVTLGTISLPSSRVIAAGLGLLILVILWARWKRKRFDGEIALTGTLIYSVTSFVIEFYRGDLRVLYRILETDITQNQVISVNLFLAAAILYVYRLKETKGRPPTIPGVQPKDHEEESRHPDGCRLS